MRVCNGVTKNYSISSILAAREDPRCLSTSSVPSSLLSRQLQTAKSKWSSEVLQLAEPLVKLVKTQLNKLSPGNYEKILSLIQDAVTPDSCAVFCRILLEKASAEQKYLQVYAKLCQDISEQKQFFRSTLLRSAQEMFKTLLDSSDRQSILGKVRFIGALFSIKMIHPRFLKDCCEKLIGQGELAVEAACYLIGSCSWVFESQIKDWVHSYLGRLQKLEMPSRVKFEVMDLIEDKRLKVISLQPVAA